MCCSSVSRVKRIGKDQPVVEMGTRRPFLFPRRDMHDRKGTDGHATDEAASGDGGVDNGNVIGQLGFESAVEVFRPSSANQTVLVGQLGEDANVVASFKLNT